MRTLMHSLFDKDLVTKDISYHPKTREELRKILEQLLSDNKNADLRLVDVSKIDDMHGLFVGLDPHDIDISSWDVSHVEDMNNMFFKCTNFNCDISKWDVRRVKDMEGMFYDCRSFDCDLSDWKVNKRCETSWAFVGCDSLKNAPHWVWKNGK